MRIVIHDYSGHPFQVQLSRSLARRGHEVAHFWSADVATPRGPLARREDDPDQLTLQALSVGRSLPKYALIQRVLQERRYTHIAAAAIAAHKPDIVVSGNAAPFIQSGLRKAVHALPPGPAGHRPVFIAWLQDIYSLALERFLPHLLPKALAGPGRLALMPAVRLLRSVEYGMLKRADGVVSITEDFLPLMQRGGVPIGADHVAVIENWATLPDLPQRPKDNGLARSLGLADKTVFLYSGTLGLKHDVSVLLALAEAMQGRDDVRIVVVSSGRGRAVLEREKQARNLAGLLLLDFLPFEDLPDLFGSADVLIAVLGEDAGVLSVPSKVLSYLCAGRPLLCAMPESNLAARLVTSTGAGVVVPVSEPQAAVQAAQALLDDPTRRSQLGAAARAVAEQKFDIEAITDRFEAVFATAKAQKA
ncbi:MAG: glycosyltransferase family 4 protein [Rhodospirillaceae bacterium]